MSYNFDFELPDFSNIDLTGLPSNLNLGPLGTSGVSTMDAPPQQIDAAVDEALSRLIAQYIQSGENPYRADYDIDGDMVPCETCNTTGKISEDFADYIKRTSRTTPALVDADIPF